MVFAEGKMGFAVSGTEAMPVEKKEGQFAVMATAPGPRPAGGRAVPVFTHHSYAAIPEPPLATGFAPKPPAATYVGADPTTP